MTKLTAVVADDEPLATQRLTMLLDRVGGVDVLATTEDGESTVEAVAMHKPDVVFLDVAMPGLDGIEVARAISASHADAAVIFITAFDQFAVAAFEVAAVDYLMKPVDVKRLERAIERAREFRDQSTRSQLPAGTGEGEREGHLEEFWASDLSGLVRIAARDIDRVSAERDYMRLHVGERSWLIHNSMAALEEGLDPAVFVRLHRSAIVRRAFITGFTRNSSGRWIARLGDGSEQPVGRLYSEKVREIAVR